MGTQSNPSLHENVCFGRNRVWGNSVRLSRSIHSLALMGTVQSVSLVLSFWNKTNIWLDAGAKRPLTQGSRQRAERYAV